MDKINAYFPVSGYDDVVALFWACFYTVSATLLIGGFILQPIADKIRNARIAPRHGSRLGTNKEAGNFGTPPVRQPPASTTGGGRL